MVCNFNHKYNHDYKQLQLQLQLYLQIQLQYHSAPQIPHEVVWRSQWSGVNFKGWGVSAKLGKHSAIWGKLGTALQAYTLNPCTKFTPNPTSRKVNT